VRYRRFKLNIFCSTHLLLPVSIPIAMTPESRSFVVVDYVIFAFMLAVSACVGFYYAIKDRRRQNTEEYLLAGRSSELIWDDG